MSENSSDPVSSARHIVSVAIPRPLDGFFTYLLKPEDEARAHVGCWVRVPFGRKEVMGFIVEDQVSISEKPTTFPVEKLKTIIEIGPNEMMLPERLMKLCRWMADYYQAPLGEVLSAAAPAVLVGFKGSERKRKTKTSTISSFSLSAPKVTLSEQQEQAVKLIASELSVLGNKKPVLLEGVTGSGKTEVYIEVAKKVLSQGQSVLLLLPEIALTPQLCSRFKSALQVEVALWHSALPDLQRREQWMAVKSGKIRVVVGARSALFSPLENLGLIVVDEEHDPAYKQEDRVRYQARDMAVLRAHHEKCLIILGSATPSMESLERVSTGKYLHTRLTERVTSGGLPQIEIVDLTQEEKVENIQAPLAQKTLEEMRRVLLAGEQVMVFLNRRGFASFLVCEDCGYSPGCEDCSVSYTVYRKRAGLLCHQCGKKEPIPFKCPVCQGVALRAVGAGTESLEEELPRLLPEMKAVRLDRDQITSNSRLEKVLDEFRSKKFNTLLGTQMLVKGHDFPGVTLVVVVLADSLFRWPDFRAPERALQVLTQVAGRAGRGATPGKVLIQTFTSDHPVLKVVRGEWAPEEFLRAELAIRQELIYPPYGRLARLRLDHREMKKAQSEAENMAQSIRQLANREKLALQVLGPSEAFLAKLKGIYRWDLLIKAEEIRPLQFVIRKARGIAADREISLVVDMDPYGLG